MTKAWHQNFKRAPKVERTSREGDVFDSKTELQRWEYLKLLVRAGELRELRRQVKFPLVVNGEHVGDYTADFVYEEKDSRFGTWCEVVEDVKGFHDALSKLRIGIYQALNKTLVRIIKKNRQGRWVQS